MGLQSSLEVVRNWAEFSNSFNNSSSISANFGTKNRFIIIITQQNKSVFLESSVKANTLEA